MIRSVRACTASLSKVTWFVWLLWRGLLACESSHRITSHRVWRQARCVVDALFLVADKRNAVVRAELKFLTVMVCRGCAGIDVVLVVVVVMMLRLVVLSTHRYWNRSPNRCVVAVVVVDRFCMQTRTPWTLPTNLSNRLTSNQSTN